ncbi:MAG: septum formation inhibitor Maf [Trueperaceae bacterium]|nr:septum formation inhibitor Maf [Trueperaceae bacterium]
MKTVPIVLASGSPRRRELLAGLGLKFAVQPADIDEESFKAESPAELVSLLSSEKARVIAAQVSDALVIAADTVVVIDGEVLNKPKDLAENRRFIERLANRQHEVFTGHTLVYGGEVETRVKRTTVQFRALSEAEIERFVATGEGLDKAGGYAIQGYGAALINHIEGCYFNVVGLSVSTVVEAAKTLGVELV